MDKKSVAMVAIIFLSLGLVLATLFWVYPPFGAGMLFVGTYIGEGFVWIVVNQPWGIVLGAGMVSMVWAAKKYDMIRSMKNVANRRAEEAKTLGTFASSGAVVRANPVVTEQVLQPVVVQPALVQPALEKKL